MVKEEEKNSNKVKKKFTIGVIIISILLFLISFIWLFAGIIAFIYSINCFRYKSSIIEKIIGLLLAIFTGPLYFIYYYLIEISSYVSQFKHV